MSGKIAGGGIGWSSVVHRGALHRRGSAPCCKVVTEVAAPPLLVRYIKVYFLENPTYIQISQLAVYSNEVNVALNGTTYAANSLGDEFSKDIPINGDLENNDFPLIYHSALGTGFPSLNDYWLLDLGQGYSIDSIVYYNRDGADGARAIGMIIDTYADSALTIRLNRFTLNADAQQTFVL